MRYLFYPLSQQPLLPLPKDHPRHYCPLPPPTTSCRRCIMTMTTSPHDNLFHHFTIPPFSSFLFASLPSAPFKSNSRCIANTTTPHHLATAVYRGSNQPPLLASLVPFSTVASLSSCHPDTWPPTTTVLCSVVPYRRIDVSTNSFKCHWPRSSLVTARIRTSIANAALPSSYCTSTMPWLPYRTPKIKPLRIICFKLKIPNQVVSF